MKLGIKRTKLKIYRNSRSELGEEFQDLKESIGRVT